MTIIGYINITKYLDWRAEVESEGRYWIYGYYRGQKVVVMKKTGIKALKEMRTKIKITSFPEGAVSIYLKSQV